MIGEKIVRLMSALVLGACVLSMSACCSTHTLRCNPEAKKLEMNLPEKLMFNIELVRYLAPTNVPGSGPFIKFGTIYLSEEALRANLEKVAVKTYPNLFTADSNAIPLQVSITRSAYSDNSGPIVCVSCLTLTILPVPVDESTEYTIQVKTDKADVNRLLSLPVSFTSDDVGRMSCFPTGWIPVFSAKGSRTWLSTDDVSKKMMLDNCVLAIATALQRVSGETWSAAPAQK